MWLETRRREGGRSADPRPSLRGLRIFGLLSCLPVCLPPVVSQTRRTAGEGAERVAERLILAGRGGIYPRPVVSLSWIKIHWAQACTWVFSTLDRNHPALGSALALRLGFHDSRTSKLVQDRETSKILLFSNPVPP